MCYRLRDWLFYLLCWVIICFANYAFCSGWTVLLIVVFVTFIIFITTTTTTSIINIVNIVSSKPLPEQPLRQLRFKFGQLPRFFYELVLVRLYLLLAWGVCADWVDVDIIAIVAIDVIDFISFGWITTNSFVCISICGVKIIVDLLDMLPQPLILPLYDNKLLPNPLHLEPLPLLQLLFHHLQPPLLLPQQLLFIQNLLLLLSNLNLSIPQLLHYNLFHH